MVNVDIMGVSFDYHSGNALHDITLSIPEGEFLVIVGPNGGGKSTLLKLIAGLIKPQKGKINIGGDTINNARRNMLLGYVPQSYGKNTAGFPASVEEIVSLGLLGTGISHKSQTGKQIVDNMLEMVGMQEFVDRRIGDLSGGQLQRVMVARALAGNPRLLLLDEPTSGIDADASTKIFSLLGSLHRKLGISIIMVSHDISNAVVNATKVACINRGLCYYGSADDFKHNHFSSRHLWYYVG